MALRSMVLVFLWGILFVTFALKMPTLVDEFHVIRFISANVFLLLGVALILPRLKQIRLGVIDALLFGFYGLNLLSLLWVDNFGEGIFTAQKYLILAVTFLLFRSLLEEDKDYRKALFPVIVAMSVLAVVIPGFQIIQQLGGEGLADKGVYQIIGHAGHKNLAASYLFFLMSLLLYWGVNYFKKPWYVILLALMFAVLVLLRSRAVYLAFGLLFTLNIAHLVLGSGGRRLALRVVLPAVVAGVVLIGVGLQFAGVGDQYAKYFKPTTYFSSASATERLFVWSKTWELIQDRPLSGHGVGNWKLFFPSKSISGGYRLQEKDLVFTRVHNDFLEIGSEVGLPGLLLFLAIFVWAIYQAYQGFRKAKTKYKWGWLNLGAGILGFALISFFDFPKERIEHLIILALLLALVDYRRSGSVEPTGLLASRLNRRILSGVLGAFLLLSLFISYHRFVGDHASRIILTSQSADQTDLILSQVDKAESVWYDVDPMVIPLSWYEGIAHYLQNDFQSAEEPFARAYSINPYNFNVVNNYASTLVQLENYQAAVPLYLEALEINPRFEEGMFNLAFSYFKSGEYTAALEWVNKTQGNPDKKQVFLNQIQAAMTAQ